MLRRVCMKKLALYVLSAFLILGMASLGNAQDLDTVSVSDQFDSGARGQETSGCGINWGGACTDGSDAVTITDASGVTGSVSYVNSWAGASGAGDTTYGESPVQIIDATYVNPDRILLDVPPITANTRPGATSATTAVTLCDDGGFNGLWWGEADDADYYAEVDVYCEDRSSLGTGAYEATSLCIRAASREGSWNELTFNMELTGSYALVYDEMLRTIEAVTWTRGTIGTAVTTRDAGSRTVHATITDVTEGWHTFRIEAKENNIEFSVDGSLLTAITDTTYDAGYAGMVYRESNVDDASEHPGKFDNMKSGPSTITSVKDWSVY